VIAKLMARWCATPCSLLFILLESAKVVGDRVCLAALGKLINLRPGISESPETNIVKRPGETVEVVVKSRPLHLEGKAKAIGLDGNPSNGEKPDDVDLALIQGGWLKQLGLNLYLRIRIRQKNRLILQKLVLLRESRRKLRVLRAKVALLPKPPETSADLPVMGANGCPDSAPDCAAPADQRLPVFSNPFDHDN